MVTRESRTGPETRKGYRPALNSSTMLNMSSSVEWPAGRLRALHRVRRWAYWALHERPPDVLPPLARGERVLAGLVDAAGAPVVATTVAIYLGGRRDAWRRLGWVELASVSWQPRPGVLHLVGLAGPEAYQVRLAGTARPRLVALALEQFAASVLISVPVWLDGGRTAAVTARRVPGSREVTWVVRLRDRADAEDPEVHGRVAAAIRQIRAETGL